MARIDLATGMILIETTDLDMVDFRPANVDELAAERERNADFAEA